MPKTSKTPYSGSAPGDAKEPICRTEPYQFPLEFCLKSTEWDWRTSVPSRNALSSRPAPTRRAGSGPSGEWELFEQQIHDFLRLWSPGIHCAPHMLSGDGINGDAP